MRTTLAIQTDPGSETRQPLTRERVLRAAVELADLGGIEGLSMRKLGGALGVDAMALYRHVRDKEDILDGAVEVVVGEIEVARPAGDWKAALRGQVMTARRTMLRHPWAPRAIEERATVGPAMLAYIEAVLAILGEGGFSTDLAHHSIHVLGSRILGFTQDLFDDKQGSDAGPEAAARQAQALAAHYPWIGKLAMAVGHEGGLGGCDDDVEFEFGLDLILDGLERLRAS